MPKRNWEVSEYGENSHARYFRVGDGGITCLESNRRDGGKAYTCMTCHSCDCEHAVATRVYCGYDAILGARAA